MPNITSGVPDIATGVLDIRSGVSDIETRVLDITSGVADIETEALVMISGRALALTPQAERQFLQERIRQLE